MAGVEVVLSAGGVKVPTLTKFIFNLYKMYQHPSEHVAENSVPKIALGANGEILQDEPNPELVVGVFQEEGASGGAADKIPGVHW